MAVPALEGLPRPVFVHFQSIHQRSAHNGPGAVVPLFRLDRHGEPKFYDIGFVPCAVKIDNAVPDRGLNRFSVKSKGGLFAPKGDAEPQGKTGRFNFPGGKCDGKADAFAEWIIC